MCEAVHLILVLCCVTISQHQTMSYIQVMIDSKFRSAEEKAKFTFARNNLISRRKTFAAFTVLPVSYIAVICLPLEMNVYVEDVVAFVGIWMTVTNIVSMILRLFRSHATKRKVTITGSFMN